MRPVHFLLFLLVIAFVVTTLSSTTFITGAKAQQQLQYRKRYNCNGDIVVVGYCRHDSDQPGLPQTTPDKDYCQVIYPERPPQGGIQVTSVELLSDVVKRLQACGAFNPSGTNPAPRPQQTPPAQLSAQPRPPASTPSSSNSGTTAQQYLDQGSKYIGAKDYEKAIEALKKSIGITPSTDAYRLLGNAYQMLEDEDDAIDAYEASVRLNPNNGRAYCGLGVSYSTLGEIDKSIASLQQAVRLNPKESFCRSELAHSYFLNGQFAEAAQDYQQVLATEPDDETRYLFGFSLLLARQRPQAMMVYQTFPKSENTYAKLLKDALDADSAGGPAKALANHGELSAIAQDPVESLAAFRNALKFKPTDPRTLYDIGTGLSGNRSFDEARNVYRAIIAAKPAADTLSGAHFGIGTDYLELKQYPAAVAELKESVRVNPKSFLAHLFLGKAYAQLNQLNEALAQIKEAEILSPKTDYVMVEIGKEYVNIKQYQKAEVVYNNAIRIDPKSSDAYFNLGHMYTVMHRKPDALRVYTTLKTLDAKLAEKLLNEINQTSAKQ